jgi:hypothetical protein
MGCRCAHHHMPITPRNRHSWMGIRPLKIKFKRREDVNPPADTKNKRQEV